jgi:hypothetical protein
VRGGVTVGVIVAVCEMDDVGDGDSDFVGVGGGERVADTLALTV